MTSERLFNSSIPPKTFIPPNKFLATPLLLTLYYNQAKISNSFKVRQYPWRHESPSRPAADAGTTAAAEVRRRRPISGPGSAGRGRTDQDEDPGAGVTRGRGGEVNTGAAGGGRTATGCPRHGDEGCRRGEGGPA